MSDEMMVFERMQRQAKLFACSSLVPEMFRAPVGMGNEALRNQKIANCFIALDIAQKLSLPPLQVMQNLYEVHGKIGWNSQFLIATFNASQKYTSIRYEMSGESGQDSFGCMAWAKELATGERLEGPLVTIGMAKAEGWDRNIKWRTLPQLMLRYRAAAFLIRTTAPEIAMGIYTVEELHDIDQGGSVRLGRAVREDYGEACPPEDYVAAVETFEDDDDDAVYNRQDQAHIRAINE